MRQRAPAAALVKKHDPVALRIKKLPMPGFTTGARPAVDKYHRQSVRSAALFHIQAMFA
jgi:hypothetical protein